MCHNSTTRNFATGRENSNQLCESRQENGYETVEVNNVEYAESGTIRSYVVFESYPIIKMHLMYLDKRRGL